MQQPSAATSSTSSYAPASERQRFLALYERESATTRKVLGAYPADRADLKPAEKSNSAQALLSTFVIEQLLILKALRHEQVLGTGWPKVADNWDGLLGEFDATREEILQLLRSSGDDIMNGAADFFVGPKTPGQIPTADFVTFMTHDQIHHRGQMSVYLRIAGGKLPSIYGPTADEPWM